MCVSYVFKFGDGILINFNNFLEEIRRKEAKVCVKWITKSAFAVPASKPVKFLFLNLLSAIHNLNTCFLLVSLLKSSVLLKDFTVGGSSKLKINFEIIQNKLPWYNIRALLNLQDK